MEEVHWDDKAKKASEDKRRKTKAFFHWQLEEKEAEKVGKRKKQDSWECYSWLEIETIKAIGIPYFKREKPIKQTVRIANLKIVFV